MQYDTSVSGCRRPNKLLILIFAVLALARAGGLVAQAPNVDTLATFMLHGVSRGLALHRARNVRDVRYDLLLDVTARDSAVGRVVVHFIRSGNSDEILDFRGRRITKVIVNDADYPDPSALGRDAINGSHIRVPATALRNGENELTFEFVAEIAPTGASIIRAHDPDGSDYLYTLLVPADANQLFPCFDQPDLKARLTFSIRAPLYWSVLANGSIVRADTAGAYATTRFAETKPLSTYLMAFAAGPWQRVSNTADGRTISVYFRRSRARDVDADTLLALTQRAITWMEQYFERRYPFEKFDLMLAPAFPFGGMEHPGVVMFNEDRFVFRERPTLPRRLGRFSTILHEVAHQWFGDLVTMRWFDDLWLKEGFATYMAAKALSSLEPQSDAWKTFYQGNKPAAYGVDQTNGTTPLWQSMDNLDQAKSAYGAIVYNKAPSVLKQLNYLVGETAFRAGVQQFLTDHAYGNATWEDLLGAISAASAKRLDDFGKNFMLRPGMPLLEQQLSVKDGHIVKLQLVQKPAQSLSGPAAWPMRTQVLLAYSTTPPVTIPVGLSTRVTDVPEAVGRPAPTYVFANYQDYGYFVTHLDSASIRSLETGELGRVSDGFLRTMLWGALWDQVRDAQISPERFARLLLSEVPREQDEQVIPALLGRLERTMRAYLSTAEQARLRAPAEQVLWTGAIDATKAFGVRRAFLDAFIALAATDDGVAKLQALITADSAAGEPVRDPTRWEIVNRLLVLNASGAEAAFETQSKRDTTADGRRRAFIAGASRGSTRSKADYFKRYFADSSLNEDWASGSLGGFNAIEHADFTLPYLRPALDSLPFIQSNRRIFFLGGWLGAFLNGQNSEAALRVVRGYLTDRPQLPKDLRQKVLQAADELERTVRIRKAWST